MLGLKYSDVNTESRTIGITKNVSTTYNRDEAYQKTGGRKTKTGTVKTKQSYQEFLEINSTALTILEELKREEPDGYDGFILHNGSKPLNHRSLVRKFHRLLKLADIETCGLHTLRHTFASKLYEQTNGDTKLVSEMLRHTSVSFTAETYIHLENKYKMKRLYDFAV
jgi:integrase